MLHLLIPLKFKKVWFIYDISFTSSVNDGGSTLFSCSKKILHPLSLSEMQSTFKKTKNNNFQRREAITYKVCSLVR